MDNPQKKTIQELHTDRRNFISVSQDELEESLQKSAKELEDMLQNMFSVAKDTSSVEVKDKDTND